MAGEDMMSNESSVENGLTYLQEMRLAKMVRSKMPSNGRRMPLNRSIRGIRNFADILNDLDEESDDEEAPVDGRRQQRRSSIAKYVAEARPELGRRRAMLSDAIAWKSMAKYVDDCDDDDDLAIWHSFYSKPVQRQLWGDPHLVVCTVLFVGHDGRDQLVS